ncbi:VWA domain-containing protein [Stygiolobus sp. CP859M]|uniref:VWA domain-containing protein n=1 Tax=Stygiolobus sp. CP859M TaxID=3133135 RepID=UPI00307D964A
MTISVKIKSSTNYVAFETPTEVDLIIRIVPETFVRFTGINYVILLDNSPSMRRENKMQTAIAAANKLSNEIPPGNYLSIYLFSNDLEKLYEGQTGTPINIPMEIKKGYTTNFYKAITKILDIVKGYSTPVKLIILSDGKPTDKRNLNDYEPIQVPPHVQIISIGIGNDYNEAIMKRLADKGAGLYYHILDPSQLPTLFAQLKVSDVAGYNLVINVPPGFEVLNYEMPVSIPILDKAITIYAVGNVPPGNQPVVLTVTGSYYDPARGSIIQINEPIYLQRASHEMVQQRINHSVVAEVRYFNLLRQYGNALMKGNNKEATQIAQELLSAAEQTRREDLIEETRKLTGDKKTDLSEITKTMRKQ